ncbi:MAG: ABC transporter permease [Chloroflexi bacterium]|nr:ABC transporter permease [Chloroflexota bacterium]
MLLLRLTVANIKMIVRNRQALFWALAFPIIFLVVFGLFIQDEPSTTTIGVIDYAQDDVSQRLLDSLRQVESFELENRDDEAASREEVRDGDLGYLLIIPQGFAAAVAQNPPATVMLVFDDTTPTGGVVARVIQRFLDQMNLELAGASNRVQLSMEGILSAEVGYLDFVLPGIAVWGVMSFSIIGMATTLASYREKKILKRIRATPLNVRTFFAAQVIAYLLLALVQAGTILGLGALMFDVSIGGNFLYIGLIVLIGNIVFLNLGFIVGAASKSVQAASGLGNAVVLPLLFFSGVFFPTNSLPVFLQKLVEFLPLAPMLEALRGIALESEPFWSFPLELAIVAAWIAITSLAAIRLFKFR